ncbi:52 kDa repressor of the inhibitor of the protein kinase isoform X3 [Mustela lutreola]|uniref:52 kDa repressor of the inhibitor of the protein kinase isoform X3 n=1 Tax=Mustela lutreola TaxID=9666 RepID=UPI002797BE1A|nr:52 kDa repressor of the inhibitor of the protein kinase isoform X3 [Mustela lutreola]
MPNFCAAPNCTRKSTQSDLAFFRFPRDPARCQKWVENCRRADLEDKTPDQLNKHYRLCAKHFETSMICRTSPYRTVLRDNAIPTIFDLTSHLNNPHSRHRKRIKELSEDEIRTLKQKKKRTDQVHGGRMVRMETAGLQIPASMEFLGHLRVRTGQDILLRVTPLVVAEAEGRTEGSQ